MTRQRRRSRNLCAAPPAPPAALSISAERAADIAAVFRVRVSLLCALSSSNNGSQRGVAACWLPSLSADRVGSGRGFAALQVGIFTCLLLHSCRSPCLTTTIGMRGCTAPVQILCHGDSKRGRGIARPARVRLCLVFCLPSSFAFSAHIPSVEYVAAGFSPFRKGFPPHPPLLGRAHAQLSQ